MPAVNFQPLVLPPGTGAPGIPGRESAGLRDKRSGHGKCALRGEVIRSDQMWRPPLPLRAYPRQLDRAAHTQRQRRRGQ
jgi:hypothetical protein